VAGLELMATPAPVPATGTHFYRYASPEHLERLKIIVLEHELYLPSLDQLNDPADGRPVLAPMSEDHLVSFLLEDFLRRHPDLTLANQVREAMVIRYNVRRYGPEKILRMLSEVLNAELNGYRVYSMSKRWDNLALWAKYAADHSGYCLEFANQGRLFANTKEVTYGDSVQMDVMNRDHRGGWWFFSKREEWSNEEEVRLVLPRGLGSKVKIDPRWLTRIASLGPSPDRPAVDVRHLTLSESATATRYSDPAGVAW